MQGLGGAHPLHSQDFYATYNQTLHILDSISVDSTNCGSCSTIVFTIEKKTTYKWIPTVQTHVVQGSTVYTKFSLSIHLLMDT